MQSLRPLRLSLCSSISGLALEPIFRWMRITALRPNLRGNHFQPALLIALSGDRTLAPLVDPLFAALRSLCRQLTFHPFLFDGRSSTGQLHRSLAGTGHGHTGTAAQVGPAGRLTLPAAHSGRSRRLLPDHLSHPRHYLELWRWPRHQSPPVRKY